MTLNEPMIHTSDSYPGIDEALRRVFTARQEVHKAPASSFLLDSGHGQRLTANFGSINDQGDAPDPDTAFRIASCTKSFTAALVLILRDAGLLNLDHPVRDYLPELSQWELPRADSAQPTIRMFLSMSAGLATDNEWADRQESMSTQDFDRLLARGVLLTSEPGTGFEYSNLGYAILGRVTEVVAGESFINLVRQHLLEPLGLRSTDFVPTSLMSRCATGYVLRTESWEALEQPTAGAFSAIGGLYSTLNDLAAWCHWLRRGFDAATDPTDRVLSKASRREMQQIHRFIPERVPATGYGFGLFITHDPTHGQVISHSGGYPGFSSHMRWQTAQPTVAIGLENATYAGVHVAVTAAFEAMLSTLTPTTAPLTTAPWPQTTQAQQAVERLLGQWDDSVLAEQFATNVSQDRSWAERRAEIQELLTLTGALNFAQSHTVAQSPAEVSWLIPGAHRTLRCSILMHPLADPLIQRFSVQLEPKPLHPDE